MLTDIGFNLNFYYNPITREWYNSLFKGSYCSIEIDIRYVNNKLFYLYSRSLV